MTTRVTRADLSELKGINPRLLKAFEELFVDTAAAGDSATAATEATGAIQSASVVTLSPNAAFANERVLQLGDGLLVDITDTNVILSLAYLIVLQGGFKCAFNLAADTSLDLPVSGRVATADLNGGPYASDAAAAAGGVQVGEAYRKAAGVVSWRQV